MDYTELLAKEVLIILFREFPGRFVLVGGGALHWIFHSPRLSVDIDLKPLSPTKESFIEEIRAALEKQLSLTATSWGVSIACRADSAEQMVQIRVDDRPALRV